MASLESSLKYESGVSGEGGSRSVATEAYPLNHGGDRPRKTLAKRPFGASRLDKGRSSPISVP